MSPVLLGLVAALAVAAVGAPSSRPSVPPGPRSRRGPGGVQGATPRRSVVAPLVAGVATAVLTGGVTGAVLGVVVALMTAAALGRLEPRAHRNRREALERQAPLLVDLVAACLASGAPLERSLEVAAAAVGSPSAQVLERGLASLRLGADPGPVWAEVAEDPALAGLARAVARSQQTGAPLSTLLPRVAEQARVAHRVRAEARIRTAAVRLTAPLGVAFLPAFVLLGVVPVVASWAGELF